MKPRNKAVNVITAIVAVLLSLLLVPTLFVTGLLGAAHMVSTPATLRNVMTTTVKNIDFEQILVDAAQDNNVDKETLEQTQTVQALMNSAAAKDFFSLFAEDLANTLSGNYDPAQPAINAQAVTAIAQEHMDELVDTIAALEPEATTAEIKTSIETFLQENVDDLVASVSVQQLVGQENVTDIAETIRLLKTVVLVLLGVCLLLAGLIYACRYYRFGGFLWLGVNTAIAFVLLLGVAQAVKTPLFLSLVAASGDSAAMVNGLIKAVSGVLMTPTWIMLGVTVLLIGLFILLKYTVLNKKAAVPTVEERFSYEPEAVVAQEASVSREEMTTQNEVTVQEDTL